MNFQIYLQTVLEETEYLKAKTTANILTASNYSFLLKHYQLAYRPEKNYQRSFWKAEANSPICQFTHFNSPPNLQNSYSWVPLFITLCQVSCTPLNFVLNGGF